MSAAAGQDTIAAAFAASGTGTGTGTKPTSSAGTGKRAALMPYLMGGFPDLETSLAIGEAYADAGADLVEVGVPFSDPLADGPVIHAAATDALSAGASSSGRSGTIRPLIPRSASSPAKRSTPRARTGFA